MLGSLLSRLLAPQASRAHDHLFSTFAPEGAPPQVLNTLYHQYGAALPDEFVPPQHRRFRALADAILGDEVSRWRRLEGPSLRRVTSAYVACFERAEAFEFQLALWRDDAAFRATLSQAREEVAAELAAIAAAQEARREYFSGWNVCLNTPLDIQGETMLDLIKQMNADDWHEIVLGWQWDQGVAELDWITSQRQCDRATAVYALCLGSPGHVATHRGREDDRRGFVRALAARLEGGFYPNAEFGLNLSMRTAAAFEWEIATARATGVSPWRLPDGLVTFAGARPHRPRYALNDGRVVFHYEHWRAQLRKA